MLGLVWEGGLISFHPFWICFCFDEKVNDLCFQNLFILCCWKKFPARYSYFKGIDHELSFSMCRYIWMPTELFTETIENVYICFLCVFVCMKFTRFFFASLQDNESWVDQSKRPSACAVVSHAVFHLDVACHYLFLHWYTTPHFTGGPWSSHPKSQMFSP